MPHATVLVVDDEQLIRWSLAERLRAEGHLERAMLLTSGSWLEPEDFSLASPETSPVGFELPANGVDLESLEQSLVIQALDRSHGNQTKAAALLGMNRDQIRYRIEKYGLTRPVS